MIILHLHTAWSSYFINFNYQQLKSRYSSQNSKLFCWNKIQPALVSFGEFAWIRNFCNLSNSLVGYLNVWFEIKIQMKFRGICFEIKLCIYKLHHKILYSHKTPQRNQSWQWLLDTWQLVPYARVMSVGHPVRVIIVGHSVHNKTHYFYLWMWYLYQSLRSVKTAVK